MSQDQRKMSDKAGMPPGSLIYTGTHQQAQIISLYQFTSDRFEEYKDISTDKLKELYQPEMVNWVDICGISHPESMENIGKIFSIHPLILEDIMDINHFPKVEETGDQLFILLKVIEQKQKDEPSIHQICLLLGESYLISFREKENSMFEHLVERIKNNHAKAGSRKEDYLFYLLVDKIVDDYYSVMENIDDDIEKLEDELINKPSEKLAQKILDVKKRFIILKKHIYPLRDELRKTLREELKLIDKPTRAYLGDIYDHLLQISQTLDIFRDLIAGLLELHLSNNDLRMNRIMTRLTVVATIFIPLTFLVGLYGMNLKMPEYHWPWFYPVLWIFMIVISAMMFLYMKKKKWF